MKSVKPTRLSQILDSTVYFFVYTDMTSGVRSACRYASGSVDCNPSGRTLRHPAVFCYPL